MYDVQLAYMVVAHSQRDPGEYLMELQQLVKAPTESLRQHAMDMHLGRFDRALQHLVAAGPDHFPKALQLARAKVSNFTRAEMSYQPSMFVVAVEDVIYACKGVHLGFLCLLQLHELVASSRRAAEHSILV